MPNLNLIKSRLFYPKSGNFLPLVLIVLLIHLTLWSVLTGVSHSAPDWDNMEQLVWASSLEWGYYKHPPLPSWIMHGMIALFGHPIWLTFFTGQLSVVLALFFIWKLGCEFSFNSISPTQHSSYAVVVMLLTSVIAYFTVTGVMNNHNTMQLWSIAGAIWMFYRATRYERRMDCAWLGVFCGFAMLTKYSVLIQFFCFFVYLAYTGLLKRKSIWQGIAIASLLCSLVTAPHIAWLIQQNADGQLNPLNHFNKSSNQALSYVGQLSSIKDLLITSLGRLAPLLFALTILVFWLKNKPTHFLSTSTTQPAPSTIASKLAASDRRFLLIIGISPLLFTLLFSFIFKVKLTSHWGTTFFLLFGFFTWWFLPSAKSLLKPTLIIVIALQLIASVGHALGRGPLSRAAGFAARSTYPGTEVSSKLLSIWRQHNNAPLTLIAGDIWIAGNVAMNAPTEVHVLIDGNYDISPWVEKDADMKCGMLIVIDRGIDKVEVLPDQITQLYNASNYQGHLSVPWSSKVNGAQLEIDWGIIPAKADCRTLKTFK